MLELSLKGNRAYRIWIAGLIAIVGAGAVFYADQLKYLFVSLHGQNILVPLMWTAVCCMVMAIILLIMTVLFKIVIHIKKYDPLAIV